VIAPLARALASLDRPPRVLRPLLAAVLAVTGFAILEAHRMPSGSTPDAIGARLFHRTGASLQLIALGLGALFATAALSRVRRDGLLDHLHLAGATGPSLALSLSLRSAAQAAAFGFSLRALDSNASCFPSTNENVAIGFYAAECCWVNGLGNTPGGEAQWLTHDLSLLRLSRIAPLSCTPGTWPCNANGRTISAAGECYGYDTSCKASYALIWVR